MEAKRRRVTGRGVVGLGWKGRVGHCSLVKERQTEEREERQWGKGAC